MDHRQGAGSLFNRQCSGGLVSNLVNPSVSARVVSSALFFNFKSNLGLDVSFGFCYHCFVINYHTYRGKIDCFLPHTYFTDVTLGKLNILVQEIRLICK